MAAPQAGPLTLDRRQLLIAAGGAGIGLVIGAPPIPPARADDVSQMLTPFIVVAPDSTVTVLSKHLDQGQGIATGLATLVAEELDARWDQMSVEFAPADAELYNNLEMGPYQLTGGSTSMSNAFEQYRKAAAAAREMLIAQAAAIWGVKQRDITVSRGVLSHPSGWRGGFGDFAASAATLEVPQDPKLKSPEQFVHIGKSFPRLESAPKSRGAPLYGIDVRRDNMLTAAIARPPKFGARVKDFDAVAAKAIKGVIEVVQLPAGLAVIATSTWPAFKGRAALDIEWDDSAAETRGSAELLAQYRKLAETPGAVYEERGDVDEALAGAHRIVEGTFEFPYLAHAPMEPEDVVIEFDGARADIWTGSQAQTFDQMAAARVLGIDPGNVAIHTLWAGGSFGRRAIYDSHIVAEAAQLARAWGRRQPLKIQWSREDDIAGGYYRPMYVHKVRAGLDGDGKLVAWHHRIVGQSILAGTGLEAAIVRAGIDPTSVEGARNLPYAIPNFRGELHTVKVGVPVLWWRAVGHSHSAYVVETMIDDLARAAGADPVAFRLGLLADSPRHAAVLKLAAERAGWHGPPVAGRHRGIALHESYRTYVAQVAEISTAADGDFRVERMVCALDCGIAVNPDNIAAQIEGGIGFGLGHALRNKITLTGGAVDQTNFDTYQPMRITDMPRVETHIVPSGDAPRGVGEPGVPPAAAAVSNALAAATGKRLYRLPFSDDQSGDP